jgi:phosphoglycerate dehydrogenase-like enzyme
MKKMVSFFGTRNEVFEKLNKQAADYAAQKEISYVWAPQIPFDRQDVVRRLQQADVGVIDIEPYDEEIFSQIKNNISLLVRFGVGFDKVDLSAASQNGIAVARTTNANTMGVAEMALSLILATRRQLKENMNCVRIGVWTERTVCNETVGATVGILGFGMIGGTLAGLLKGFDCRIIAYDPFPNEALARELRVEFVDREELFKSADAISVHVPYSPQTHNMVNREMLGLMKPSAVIVNTSRGNVVDEDALYEALRDRSIRGAALDVFGEEPMPLNSPLLTLDNILLTPHISSQTEESLWRIYAMAIDIAADFFAGKDVPHILNPDYKQYMRG